MQLELKNVSVGYPQSGTVLNNINLCIEKGEFISIVGKAGCGKTTFIETIGGFHKPDKGFVEFDREDIYQTGFNQIDFRRKMQIVFQFPENQFFESDVFSETSFGLKRLNLSENVIEQRVYEALNNVGLNNEPIYSLSPFALSGGQKRRLALACALVIKPDILLLDEPFSGLDAEGTELLMEILRKENAKGLTVIMVSHDPDIICELSDRIICFSDGKLKMDDSPSQVYKKGLSENNIGIGIPETLKFAEIFKLDLGIDLTYNSFLQKLIENIKEKYNA